MIDAFVTYLQAERRYSALTVRNYRHDIETFAAWCAKRSNIEVEKADLSKVTTEDIREWIIYRIDTDKIKAASMNREISSLRCFYKYLRHQNIISQDIVSRITTLRTERKLPTFVPESRMNTLLDTIREKSTKGDFKEQLNGLIITLFYSCGIRLAELTNIKIGDFSSDSTTLRICGKGNKQRMLPILPETGKRVRDFISTLESLDIPTNMETQLIVSEEGKPLARSTIQRVVKRELAEANVQGKKSPHILRHTFATHLLNKEADMRDIQELMGHSSLRTTQCYTHNSIAKLQEVYKQAHPHR